MNSGGTVEEQQPKQIQSAPNSGNYNVAATLSAASYGNNNVRHRVGHLFVEFVLQVHYDA
jgi:hypothetical protein